jgi:voltage-gated potassium channel Kch
MSIDESSRGVDRAMKAPVRSLRWLILQALLVAWCGGAFWAAHAVARSFEQDYEKVILVSLPFATAIALGAVHVYISQLLIRAARTEYGTSRREGHGAPSHIAGFPVDAPILKLALGGVWLPLAAVVFALVVSQVRPDWLGISRYSLTVGYVATLLVMSLIALTGLCTSVDYGWVLDKRPKGDDAQSGAKHAEGAPRPQVRKADRSYTIGESVAGSSVVTAVIVLGIYTLTCISLLSQAHNFDKFFYGKGDWSFPILLGLGHVALTGGLILLGGLLARPAWPESRQGLLPPIGGVVIVLSILGPAWFFVGDRSLMFSLSWCLVTGPLLFGLPFLRISSDREPDLTLRLQIDQEGGEAHASSRIGEQGPSPKHTGETAQRLENRVKMPRLTRLHVDLIRASLLLTGIIERNIAAVAFALPLSLYLSVEQLLPAGMQPNSGLDRVGLWAGVAPLWLGPFLFGLYHIGETLEAIYTTQMRRCVQNLRDHVLVLGYGDLGRRYVRELFQIRVVAYSTLWEHLARSRYVLLPNGALGKVLMRIAAIERNSAHLAGVTNESARTPIGHADITRLVQHVANPRPHEWDALPPAAVRFVIPIISGDAVSEEVQNLARLEEAAFVSCLLRATDGQDHASQLFQRLRSLAQRGRFVPAALAVRSSTYPAYLVEGITRHRLPVHYVLPSQLEGLNAGNLLHAVYRRLAAAGDLDAGGVPILVCGQGKRLFYLIDSFLRTMGLEEYNDFARRQNARPVIAIVTIDDEFVRSGVECPPDDAGGKAARDAGDDARVGEKYWKDWDKKTPYGVVVWKVARHVSRSPLAKLARADGSLPATSTEGKPEGSVMVVAGEPVCIPLIPRDSRDFPTTNNIISTLKPKTVLVSDHEADDEFRIIHAVSTAVARIVSQGAPQEPPMLLVTGETGKHHLEKNFQQAAAMYQSVVEGVGGNSATRRQGAVDGDFSAFPDSVMQWSGSKLMGDPFIDVLEDPVERFVALTRAYLGRTAGEIPVEMNFCVPDSPGSLADILCGLSGCDAVPAPKRHEIVKGASFTNSRFVSDKGQRFVVRSYMELHHPTTSGSGHARAAVIDGDLNDPGHSAWSRDPRPSENRDPLDRKHVLRTVLELVDPSARRGRHRVPGDPAPSKYVDHYAQDGVTEGRHIKEGDDPVTDTKQFRLLKREYLEQATQCCGMPTCPIEPFNRIALTALSNPQFRYNKQINSIARCFAPGTWDVPKSVDSEERALRRPLASIRIECEQMNVPGSYAAAINAMLLRTVVPSAVGKNAGTGGRADGARSPAEEKTQYAFDFTYLSSYECHDERFGVFTCYGRRVKTVPKGQDELLPKSVIRMIEVRPATRPEEWKTYVEELEGFLNCPSDFQKELIKHTDHTGLTKERGWRFTKVVPHADQREAPLARP